MSAAHRSLFWMLAFVGLSTVVEMLRVVLHGSYSDYQLIWTRYGVHLAFMLVVFGPTERANLFKTPRLGFQLARSMMMLVMPASYVIGLQLGGNTAGMWELFWVAPLIILVMARVFLHETVHLAIWIAAFIAFAGASLLTVTRQSVSLASGVCAFVMALAFSTYVVMTRSLRHERTSTNLFYSALGVFVALIPMMFSVWRAPSANDTAVMVAIGVLGVLTLFAVDRMTSLAPVATSAPVAYWQVLLLFGALRGLSHVPIGRRLPAALAAIMVATLIAWVDGGRTAALEQA